MKRRRQAGRQAGAKLMPTSPRNHIGQAIAELEAERVHLSARLAKLDEAIATMRELFHLPRALGRRGRHPMPAATSNGHEATFNAIRTALARGPMSPADLAERLNISRHRLRATVAPLEDAGVLTSTGATASRRIALTGTPAKEAP
jgi:biotin operon repressor